MVGLVALVLARWEKRARNMDSIRRSCCIRGYHVYKDIWAAAVGEVLVCEREHHNIQGIMLSR